jgi:hypothetical protein
LIFYFWNRIIALEHRYKYTNTDIIMSRSIFRKAGLISLMLVLAFSYAVLGSPARAAAGSPPARVDPTLQKIFDTQLCPALLAIPGQRLSGQCTSHAYQKDQDKAEKKICHKYGGYELKSQCQAYAAAAAALASPGDPAAACAADPTSAACGSDVNAACGSANCDLVQKYINPLVDVLSVAFGLIAVISIIVGGIQYSASGGDPQKITAAKRRISQTMFAIVAYAFLFAFLQFLIPGGLFH